MRAPLLGPPLWEPRRIQHLLVDAMHRCLDLGKRLGVHAIEVEAIDEAARRFYEKYGFVSLLDDPRHLYLPVGTIIESFRPRVVAHRAAK